MIPADFERELLVLLAADPLKAADRIDGLADQLRAAAARVRDAAAASGGDDGDGAKAPDGMTDRVRARVLGPDGTLKQTIDTAIRP